MVVLTCSFVINERIRGSFHSFRYWYKAKQGKNPRIFTSFGTGTDFQDIRGRINTSQCVLSTRTCVNVQIIRDENGPTLFVRLFVVEWVYFEGGARCFPFLRGGDAIRRHKVRGRERPCGESSVRLSNVVRGLRWDRFYFFRRWELARRINTDVPYGA